MIVLHDQDTLLHETVELLGSKLIPALESPARIQSIVEALKSSQRHDLRTISTNNEDRSTAIEFAKATHESDYLEHVQTVFQQWRAAGLVEQHEVVLPECFRLHSVTNSNPQPPRDIFARAGYYAFDMSSGICQHSWQAIVASANLAVQAALLIQPTSAENLTTSVPSPPITAMALCRPPGHHCTGTQAGGYCYINNVAVCLTSLRRFSQPHAHNPPSLSASKPRFAILDLDFHHGNGTQEQFYSDPTVLYVSIHGQDEFPYYTGFENEQGPEGSAAYGTNLNLPLPTGSSFEAYREKLHTALEAITAFGPDYLLVSLGFDTFHLDPLGKFGIETGDYRAMAKQVRSAIQVPAVILLEGGYVVDRLGENLLNFLDGWEEAETEKGLIRV